MVGRAGWEEICRRSRWEGVDGGLREGHNESERLTEPTPSIPSIFCKSQLCFALHSQPCGSEKGQKGVPLELGEPKKIDPKQHYQGPGYLEKKKKVHLAPVLSLGPKDSEGA